MVYEIYGFFHKIAKHLLKRNLNPLYKMVDIQETQFDENEALLVDSTCTGYINNYQILGSILKKQVFPVENIVRADTFQSFPNSFSKRRRIQRGKALSGNEAEKAWKSFIEKSIIPKGYLYSDLHYGGFILEYDSWCLPSWIWTNAALVRMYCSLNLNKDAIVLADHLIALQEECGGWVVRNDYDNNGSIPVLAPNDSAYIANNACLEVYLLTRDPKYLLSAEKCADWIIQAARRDGFVYVGYNQKTKKWQTNYSIVDVGFTAALFARLFRITENPKYKSFLERFVSRYIDLFFNSDSKGFATGLDSNDNQIGGMFGRGQAWALEGLIESYKVLEDETIKQVIDQTIGTLLRKQTRSGGWPYNLSRPLMGIDCKAVPIIALSILKWRRDLTAVSAAQKALKWVISHTSSLEESFGGIFSYSIEGAIVHHLYSNTAFVYSCAYALELKKELEKG